MLTGEIRRRFIRQRLSYVGLVVAAFTYAAALVPSLLPRSLVFLVTLAALGVVGGYALGALLSWVVNKIPAVKARPIPTKWAVIIVIVAWIPPLIFTPIAITWQSEQQTALDMPSPLPGTILFLIFSAVVSVILLLIGGGEPPEVGPNYSANMAGAIATTLGAPGWTSAQTVRRQGVLPGLPYSSD